MGVLKLSVIEEQNKQLKNKLRIAGQKGKSLPAAAQRRWHRAAERPISGAGCDRPEQIQKPAGRVLDLRGLQSRPDEPTYGFEAG